MLHTATGESRRTFVDSDGTFALYDVPPGAHMLQPFLPSLIYPEVRVPVCVCVWWGPLVRPATSITVCPPLVATTPA